MRPQPAISRHRLPRPYRLGLTILWILPLAIFVVTIALYRGVSFALFDPRFLLPALLMLLPALYIWQEGIDVLPDGIIRRMHLPRYFSYGALSTWTFDSQPDRRVLTVWNHVGQKVVECRAAHLTDFPTLLVALRGNVTIRGDASGQSSV